MASEPSVAPYQNSVITRYRDAYRIASFQTGVGRTIKMVSLGLGGLVTLISFISMTENAKPQPGFFGPTTNPIGVTLGWFGVLAGLLIAGIGFIFGLLVSSQGEVLKAGIDGAVNTSPFVTNEERAQMMSL